MRLPWAVGADSASVGIALCLCPPGPPAPFSKATPRARGWERGPGLPGGPGSCAPAFCESAGACSRSTAAGPCGRAHQVGGMGTRPSRHRAAGARLLAACRRPGEAPGFPSSGPIAGGEPTQAPWVSTPRFQFARCVLKEETGVHGCGGARWHLRFSALHSHLPSPASRAPPWFRPPGLPGGGGGVHFLGALPWSPPPPSSVGSSPPHLRPRAPRPV